MLKRLREMITGNFVKSVEGTEEREHALRLATATLLVEVVRADQEEAVVEEEVVLKQLGNFLIYRKKKPLCLFKQQSKRLITLFLFNLLLGSSMRISLLTKNM